ncbi:hypothetical protein [Geodermatophilus sp. SYSU D00684]
MTSRRLTSLAARIRQHGGPTLTASAVRALSIRLIWSIGGNVEASGGLRRRNAPHTVLDAEVERRRLGRLKRHLLGDQPELSAEDDPSSTDR